MTPQRKNQLSNGSKELKLSTFIVAFFTAAALFVPYIIAGKGYFIFYGDFNVQQIPFYKMCHAAIRGGAVKWSFTTDLGANFIGSYAFYLLGSPFFWLTIPFPNGFVPYLMGPLLIIKFACAAFTAYLYIRRFTKTPEAARLGALLYAFSGFSVYNIFFNHFHEAIIVFPLLLLALEYLAVDNRRGVFALAVALCAVTNYFFFFGMTVFCIIYYFVRVKCGEIKFKASRFLWLAFEAVLGVCLSAVILLPAVMAILGNSRISNFLLGWGALTYRKEQIYLNVIECFFFPPDLPARPVFFPEAEVRWSSLGGWLPLFGMTGVISWFYAKKKNWIKRIIIICIIMALIPILNSAFYAFNSSYYARWFYMPILIMCIATARVCEEEDISLAPGIWWSAVITLGFTVLIGLFPQRKEDKIILGLFTNSDTGDYKMRFWVTALISVCSIVALMVITRILSKNRRRFILAATAAAVAVSIIYGNFFIALGRTHSYNIPSVIIDSLIEGKVQLEGDKDTFRIDTYGCVDNTAMYLEYSSINAFHSVVPASVMQFYEYVGEKRDVGSRPGTDNPALRPLLSVKYLLDRDGDNYDFTDEYGISRMAGYSYIGVQNGFKIYENKNFVGYGFSTKYYVTEEFLENYSGPQRARIMLKAVLLTEKQAKKYSHILTDISEIRGETLSEDEINLDLTDSEMAKDAKLLNFTSAKSFKTDNSGFTAVVNRDKESLVIFSLPYDKGFSATVNGKKADIEKVDKGLMAVKVGKGESEIRFEYKTPGLYTGIIISLVSLLAFAVYLLAYTFTSKKGNRTETAKK